MPDSNIFIDIPFLSLFVDATLLEVKTFYKLPYKTTECKAGTVGKCRDEKCMGPSDL
jgi:hypothetical protein